MFDDPYSFYAQLREHDPVYFHDETQAWFLLRYEDVMRCLKDAGTFSSGRLRAMLAPQLPQTDIDSLRFYQHEADNMLFSDGDKHAVRRELANRAFVPTAIEHLRPQVQKAVNELLDGLQDKTAFNFVAEFSNILPVQIICDMFAVPEPMRKDFVAWTHSMSKLFGGTADMQQALAAAEDHVVLFHDYIEKLIRARRKNLGSDVLSLMIKNQDHNKLSDHQVAIQAVQIVAAGHITTVDLLGNAMAALLQHPQQLQRLRDDPAMIHSAVEEMLRYDTSIPLTHRMATRDVVIGGKTIKKGDLVFPILASANRDPRVFDQPDTFDIGRAPNPHLSFVAGPHFCAGAALARMELNLTFTTLLRRLGDITLSDHGLAWKQGHLMFRGPSKLCVKMVPK